MHEHSIYVNPQMSSLIYFDNNGTTLICPAAVAAVNKWLSCYNASADSFVSQPAKRLIEDCGHSILDHCGVNSAAYTCVFTSGATESNCFIIRACVKAMRKKLVENGLTMLPHVIISQIEHSSVIECVEDLVTEGCLEADYVRPTIFGNIMDADVEALIKPTTCLISVMYANNEIPVINDLQAIVRVAHKHKIPVHSDAVQIFGKYRLDLHETPIDAVSFSSHKFYGPKGIGALLLSNQLISGYKLTAEINGHQQHGLRGGTENVPMIAGMTAALHSTFKRRKEKNTHLFDLRNKFLEKMAKLLPVVDYAEFLNKRENDVDNNVEIVIMGPPIDLPEWILPNTLLISVCKYRGRPFCNVQLKQYLDKHGVVVSIGSACNTKSDKASHVLYAIGAPPVIRRGVLRVSFGDHNTKKEVDRCIKVMFDGIMKQCTDISLRREEDEPDDKPTDKPSEKTKSS